MSTSPATIADMTGVFTSVLLGTRRSKRRPDENIQQVILGGIPAEAIVVVRSTIELAVRGVLESDLRIEPREVVDLERGTLRGRPAVGTAKEQAGGAGRRPGTGRGG